ncbi:MAG: ribonuclease III [Pyrinomonadaceae bacterium]|nr:ribonuclease III [Pyrinomonadaceae bacterium]MBP6212224.1 ribonuclease III [Pyrinomonadaceae bacterium]
MSASIAQLENLIGHKFQDVKLVERAMTHRSWAFENLPDLTEESIREFENESLEFVGDSVLGLIVAEQLYLANPKLSEGDLTLMKHRLVSTATLARVGEEMGLGAYVRFGRGEEKTGGRKKAALLANTLEALIGAVFFDGGYVAARVFVGRILSNEFRAATPQSSLDYKSLLQETLQAQKMSAPTYELIRSEGPPHERTFYVEAVWKTGKARGEGNSIKLAEMKAAAEALSMLGTAK